MSANSITLKAALIDFLKNDTVKQPTITLDCNWGHSLKLSDNKNYYFVSKDLKKQLKEDSKLPEGKNFRITLSKWNFIVKGTKKGVREVDLDVKKYSIKTVKEEIDFGKRNKDLVDYPDIRSKLEVDSKTSAAKASVKKAKARANEKVKEIHAEPKVDKKSTKEAPAKKKIDKVSNSGSTSVLKTLKSNKTANKNADSATNGKSDHSVKESPALAEINFIDIIKAKEFDGFDVQRSATKILNFQTTNTNLSRMPSPHQVNQESLHRLSSALGRASIIQNSFENVLPDSLKKQGLTYKEFLIGRNSGLVSAKEIVFTTNAIQMFLKDYKTRSVDPYN